MRCYYACEKNGAHTKWQKFGFKIIMLETLVKHDCFLQPRIKILKDSLYDAYKGPYIESVIYKLEMLLLLNRLMQKKHFIFISK